MTPPSLEQLIRAMPKAELHVHVEGTLEPELMLELAARNGVAQRFETAEAARRARSFRDLQGFLDVYYEATTALRHERDFYELTRAYLRRAAAQNIRHVELSFDPQAHTARGVPFAAVVGGIHAALQEAGASSGISSRLIMCFLRDRGAEAAGRTLREALPFRERIAAVGLDSAERDHPPRNFVDVYARAREVGWRCVAHAGEEGPAAYVAEALDLLGASRIDHGVRCVEDPRLVERLAREQVPLTVCPLSNVRLGVFDALEHHNLKLLLERGLRVTVNSDDPAYFGGYLVENLLESQRALGLTWEECCRLERNAFEASFLDPADKGRLVAELERFAASAGGEGSAAAPRPAADRSPS